METSFTIAFKIDLSAMIADEPLCEAGPMRLAVRMAAGEPFVCKFVRDGEGPALILSVDPRTREASFKDDQPDAVFDLPWKADNFKIGGLRGVDGEYEVKVVVWHDRKANATIFDAEIGGMRTMICRRDGKFSICAKTAPQGI